MILSEQEMSLLKVYSSLILTLLNKKHQSFVPLVVNRYLIGAVLKIVVMCSASNATQTTLFPNLMMVISVCCLSAQTLIVN